MCDEKEKKFELDDSKDFSFNTIDKHALKLSMTIDDVWEYCTSIGMKGSWISDEKLVFETACHNPLGQGRHKLFYYHNTRLFSCYTGCSESFDLFELISKMGAQNDIDIELDDAIDMYTKTKDFLIVDNDGNESQSKVKEIDKKYEKPVYSFYDKKILSKYPRAICLDWVREGITPETQRKYGVIYDAMDGGVAFPHYAPFGQLLGVRERFLSEETIERTGAKYMPLRMRDEYCSSPLSMYLFGVNFNQNAIRYKKKAIVFEGEKSVMLADEYMGENNYSVASFGMKLSRHQFEILKELDVDEIIIAFDKQFTEDDRKNGRFIGSENEYIQMFNIYDKISSNYEDFGIKITFMYDMDNILDYKDSPIDKGIANFHRLFQERKTLDDIIKEEEKRGNYLYIKDEEVPF